MAPVWSGTITILDVAKGKAVLLGRGPEGSAMKEQVAVISWDRATRVTESGRGLIPIQQLRAGQVISADCVQNQDGGWVARAIEIVKPRSSQPQALQK